MQKYSPQFLQKRKFLLVLPLLVTPFLLMLCYLLGVGKGDTGISAGQKPVGLNPKLPDAQFKKAKEKTKMTLYEEMSRDSARILEKIKQDPFYMINRHDSEVSADQVEEKLEALKKIIHSNPTEPQELPKQTEKPIAVAVPARTHNADLDQLNTMLDKVMAIQHPQILQDSLVRFAQEHKPPSYPVELSKPSSELSGFGSVTNAANRFYDLAEDISIEKERDHSIEAEVAETQVVVSGSTVKLRLLNEVIINGHPIAKNECIYGTVRLSGERLQIQFSSIRSGNLILPVSLQAFDLDGLAGIYIPGSMERETLKTSGDQAISSMGIGSLDPSIAAQAASAGIQAAKTLMSHQVKLIKVTLKAGYHLLLKESK